MNRRALIIAGLVGSTLGLPSLARSAPRPDYENKLKALGITLPDAPAPVANYVPFRRVGNLLYIAGQGPAITAGGKVIGTLGTDLGIKEGYGAARSAGLNVLAQLRSALGSLNAVRQCVKLGGFVNSADDFHDQPAVINGASDLMVEVFGEAGKHARFAVGVNTLPFNVAVEIESVWEV
ncbi:MAG: hypothetical protein COA85_03020, partial [Robiginitomaculum sp.]